MGVFKTFAIFFMILSLFFGLLPQYYVEARPLMKNKWNDGILEKMSTFGVATNSGPSPGDGNAAEDWNKTLGGMKNDGPSPGVGHKHETGDGK